jgi:two-component system LytT family sensor kinase
MICKHLFSVCKWAYYPLSHNGLSVALFVRKKILLVFGGFIVLYYLVRGIYHLPAVLHGEYDLNIFRGTIYSPLQRVVDLLIAFLFAAGPYLILYYFYPRQKWVPGILCTAAAVAFAFLVSYGWTGLNTSYHVRMGSHFKHVLFFDCLYILYGAIFFLVRFAHYNELRERELKFSRQESELSLLRSQFNPHFLFNNLNNIYSLVYEKSANALPAIAALSDLLRYMLYDAGELVSFENEVAYMKSYVALQQMRFQEEIAIDFRVEGSLKEITGPPLLFIPFLENAFKHGELSGGLTIYLSVEGGKIVFLCRNNIAPRTNHASGGIGLENIRKRLELVYPARHRLQISNEDGIFSVKLELIYG